MKSYNRARTKPVTILEEEEEIIDFDYWDETDNKVPNAWLCLELADAGFFRALINITKVNGLTKALYYAKNIK